MSAKRYLLTVLLLMAMLGATAISCAPQPAPTAPTQAPSQGEPSQPEPTKAPAAQQVEITYARYAGSNPIDLEFVKEFEASHPNIKVNTVDVPGEESYNKILLQHQGGNPPDVFWTHWPLAAATGGIAENLDPYIEKAGGQAFVDRFMSGPWTWGSWKGSQYAIPWRAGASVVYFNKDLLDAANLETPKEGWTWDDFSRYCKALTKPDGSQYGFALIGAATDPGTEWNYWPFLLQAGGQILKDNRAAFNSPEGVAALQYLVDMINTDKVAPPGTASNDVNQVIDLFVSGKAAMWMNGPWYIGTMKATYPDVKVSVAPMPKGVKGGSISGGTGMAIAKLSKHKEEAWELVQFLTSDENLTKWAVAFEHVAPNKAAANDPFYKEPNMAAAMAQQLSDETVPANYYPETDQLNQIMRTYLQAAYLKQLTPKEALDKAAAEWDAILQKYD